VKNKNTRTKKVILFIAVWLMALEANNIDNKSILIVAFKINIIIRPLGLNFYFCSSNFKAS
jgi:hypothetical protein